MLKNIQEWRAEMGTGRVTKNQYYFSGNVSLRRHLQENTIDGRSIHAEAMEALMLEGNETLLDEGFGDGRDLLQFAKAYPGLNMYGMDIPGEGFGDRVDGARTLLGAEGVANMPHFISGYARKIPLPTNSVDVALLYSMLYHEEYIRRAMYENQRVVKEGGKLAMITNGIHNRQLVRGFVNNMADELGTKAPKPLSARFDLDKADSSIRRYFGVVERIEQNTLRKITEDDIPSVVGVVDSYRLLFPREKLDGWLSARKRVVEEPLAKRIEDNGGFIYETVHWGAYILVNDRPASTARRLANLAIAA